MTTTRRDFLKITALTTGALVIGFDLEGSTTFHPNAWIAIDSDGIVTLTVGKTEMGQGVRTSLPMILADELDADWSKVRIVQASPSNDFKRLGTGGSWSIGGGWMPLRTAGAAAREMLVTAAATKWGVDAASCVTRAGVVTSGKHRATYGELVAAAAKLPVPDKPKLKEASEFRIIGQRKKRLDAPQIVNGSAKYGIDIRVPNMRYASVARGNVKRWKPVENAFAISTGVAFVAKNSWAAMKGRDALDIEFEPAPPFDSGEHAKRLEAAARAGGVVTRKEGNGEQATRHIEAVYQYPFYVHAPIEPMNCVAHVHHDRAEIWAPTQAPNTVQDRVAKQLNLDPSRVTVHVTLVGGGFGRRLGADYALEAAELSKAIDAPVQVLWTREDDMQHGYFQGASAHYLRAGIDSDGRLAAWTHTKAGSPHNARGPEPSADELKSPETAQGLSWGVYDIPYAIPSIETGYVPISIPVKHGPWRAVFAPGSVFARESFIDEIAHELQKDPVAFRLELLKGEDVIHAGDGDSKLEIDRRRLRRVIELAAEKSKWGTPGRARGFACNVYDGSTHIAYVVELNGSRIERVVAAVDCGLAINPSGIEQQVEGGIIWALSQATKSSITFRDGVPQQRTIADYDVARMRDTPAIEVHLVAGDPNPFGMGEPPVPPLAPALANAIFAATGKRQRSLPLAL